MATRLAAAVVCVGLVSLAVATFVGLATGRNLGEDLFINRLDALRTSADFDASAQMGTLARTTTALADSPQAAAAIERFTDGYDRLVEQLADDPGALDDETDALIEACDERYVAPLQAAGQTISFQDIVPSTPQAIRLQTLYAVDLGVADAPDEINDAGDGSDWSETHALAQPVYRDVADRLGVVDLFLVEPQNLDVVYSVRKQPELGTSLNTGAFSGSVLASTVEQVVKDPSAGTQTSDLAFYPSTLAPIGVVASPVYQDDVFVGVLATMYDSAPLTAILTADGEWEDAGYPETSDTYLAGSDGTTRSDPRGFVEDPVAFLDAVQAAGGLTDDERAQIEARDTTVLTLNVDDATFHASRDEDSDVVIRQTVAGNDVFSTVAPLSSDQVPWWTIAEMDASSARSDVDQFRELLIVGVAIFVVLLAFAAVFWATGIVRPIREIGDRLARRDRFDAEPEALNVPDRSPIEFHRLAASFESMAASLRAQRAEVSAARTERLDLLRKMLPPAVAQRVEDGSIQALEEVPQVTVGVAVVVGLGALVEIESGDASRALVDRLLAELDDLAERHGIERVKVVGDAYFAACGHDRPYLDHAPRLVAFASDARDAIRELGAATRDGLDLTAGVHTGPVTVGMTGGARLVYDVWGETVTVAHAVVRRGRSGQILVTETTRQLLPDSIVVEPFDDGDPQDVTGIDATFGVWSVETATVKGSA
jgi:class 3 adenylate cyclase